MSRYAEDLGATGTRPDASIAGVILAGGRGARMGGADKGWISWQGKALVEHVYARLQPQVARILVSANRNLERYRALAGEIVEDDATLLGAYPGPLAGMLAAMERAPRAWLAFVPCDAPRLPLDLVARLAQASAGRWPAVARCADRIEPVFCLLPCELAPALQAALAAGERRPQVVLREVGAVEAHFDDPAAFTNINCPEEARSVGAA